MGRKSISATLYRSHPQYAIDEGTNIRYFTSKKHEIINNCQDIPKEFFKEKTPSDIRITISWNE